MELTKKVIGRIKGLFIGKEFKSKESVAVLNGCKIEAFPTNHLEQKNGLCKLKILLFLSLNYTVSNNKSSCFSPLENRP